MDKKFKGITLRKETIKRLDTIKHIGQSYDGLITELIGEQELNIEAHRELRPGTPEYEKAHKAWLVFAEKNLNS